MSYEVPVFGNPKGTRKPPKKKGKNMSKKKGKKKGSTSRNPFGLNLGSVKGAVTHGLALGLGAVLTRAVANNLPLPAALQGGIGEAAGTAGVAFGLGFLAKKVKFSAPYAASIRDGGLALAAYKLVAPQALPILAFTSDAKAKANLDQQAYQALATLKAAQANAMVPTGAAAANGVGDAFIMSRGGITTADRAPRDTAALAGVGDAYAAERPGFSGAPNNLGRPWGSSIYHR